jgi:hypothetical protein
MSYDPVERTQQQLEEERLRLYAARFNPPMPVQKPAVPKDTPARNTVFGIPGIRLRK